MNEKDLRIVKTKQLIYSAFMELLSQKSIEKISVTELAKKAMINKGTFYLHYRDIYDLFDKVSMQFVEQMLSNAECFGTLFKDTEFFIIGLDKMLENSKHEFSIFAENHSQVLIMPVLSGYIADKIVQTEDMEDTVENHIKANMIVNAFFGAFPKYRDDDYQLSLGILKQLVFSLFPDRFK